MASNSFTYAAKDIAFILGPSRIAGWAKDSFVEITYNSPAVELQVGADGEACRSFMSDNSAKITIRLLENSAANRVLGLLLTLDRFTQTGVLPVMIRDPSTDTTHTSGGCWVVKPPKKHYKGKSEVLEWELESDSLEYAYNLL